MSAARDRLLSWHAHCPDPSFLNLSYALAVEGRFDPDCFAWAVGRLLERYPELGTIEGDLDRVLLVEDLTELSPGDRGRRLDDLARRERTFGFTDLDGPLIRLLVVRLSGGRFMLHVTLHHCATDGWGMGLLMGYLSAAYRWILEGDPPLEEGDASPPRAAVAPDKRMERERAAFAESLKGLSDAAHAPIARGTGGTLACWTRRHAPAFLERTRAAALGHRVTLFALLCRALSESLRILYGREDLLIGTTVLNRHGTAELAVVEPRYEGALIPLHAGGDWRALARATSAAVDRILPYGEQLRLATAVLGAAEPVRPPVFAMIDTHPLDRLTLPGARIRYLEDGETAPGVAREARSPALGDLAVFWRLSEAGATLNLFAHEGAGIDGAAVLAEVDAVLHQLADTGEIAVDPPNPWEGTLFRVSAARVDALSPVSCPPSRRGDRGGDMPAPATR
ncbi:condensation domain-containing protein [Rhodospirillum sp. A1_3_36]|uniref:condensation domain-containing protein n=1 Tax=Rhodospirillum sp. A1_3_36 TaxID=3391666 RepID=UPI0039A70157